MSLSCTCFVVVKAVMSLLVIKSMFFELFHSSLQLLCAASANAMVTWRTSVLKTLRRSSWSLFLLWTTASGISLMGSAGCATVSSLSLYIIILLYIILEENCEKLCLQRHRAISLNVSFCLTYIQKPQRFHSRWLKPRKTYCKVANYQISELGRLNVWMICVSNCLELFCNDLSGMNPLV